MLALRPTPFEEHPTRGPRDVDDDETPFYLQDFQPTESDLNLPTQCSVGGASF